MKLNSQQKITYNEGREWEILREISILKDCLLHLSFYLSLSLLLLYVLILSQHHELTQRNLFCGIHFTCCSLFLSNRNEMPYKTLLKLTLNGWMNERESVKSRLTLFISLNTQTNILLFIEITNPIFLMLRNFRRILREIGKESWRRFVCFGVFLGPSMEESLWETFAFSSINFEPLAFNWHEWATHSADGRAPRRNLHARIEWSEAMVQLVNYFHTTHPQNEVH